jgi:hypothetical protein
MVVFYIRHPVRIKRTTINHALRVAAGAIGNAFVTRLFSAALREARHARAVDRGAALFPARAGFTRSVREAFGEVAALLFGSATFGPHPAIDREIYELVAPHLAILIHKRARFASERWSKELHDFVQRTFFWPEPAATETFGKLDRGALAAMVERIVIAEQARTAAALPQTRRFDSSWAD